MIQVMPGTKVYLACRPVSMRYGFDGLAAQVKQVLAANPFSGHLFLFRSKRADYLKILYYDGTGLCLFAKRLESGKFVWPPIVDGGMVLTPAQLALLLEAIDWRRTVAADLPRTPVAV
jgi:transposase